MHGSYSSHDNNSLMILYSHMKAPVVNRFFLSSSVDGHANFFALQIFIRIRDQLHFHQFAPDFVKNPI
jgi:hypothetical protein